LAHENEYQIKAIPPQQIICCGINTLGAHPILYYENPRNTNVTQLSHHRCDGDLLCRFYSF